jgi:hypothetical protein
MIELIWHLQQQTAHPRGLEGSCVLHVVGTSVFAIASLKYTHTHTHT